MLVTVEAGLLSQEQIGRILDLRREGLNQRTVAIAVGVSQSSVSNVLRKYGSMPRRRRRVLAKDRIASKLEVFLRDPRGAIKKLSSARLSDAVCLVILKECQERIGRNQAEALVLAEAAVNLFSIQSERARVLDVYRRFKCHQAQAQGLLAACYKRSGLGEKAEEELRQAIAGTTGCAACQSDLYRRLALVQVYRVCFPEALESLENSLYHCGRFEGPGHDLDGTPEAKILAARTEVLVYCRKYDQAIQLVTAAQTQVPEDARGLRTHLLTAKAWAQLRLPGRFPPVFKLSAQADIEGARETLGELLSLYDFDDDSKHSTARAGVHWLAGVVDGIDGNRVAAEFKLGVAQDDYTALEMPAERVACAIDRARFATPTQSRACLVALSESGDLGRFRQPVKHVVSAPAWVSPHMLIELRDYVMAS